MKEILEEYQKAIEYFKKLPEETLTEYERMLAKYSNKCSDKNVLDALNLLVNDTEDDNLAFAAFFCLTIFYRRHKDFELLHKLINNHPEFKSHKTYNHIIVSYMVHSESFYDYEQLLHLAYDDLKTINNNVGYYQAFSNAFATICEKCNSDDKEHLINEWYDLALSSINKAIELDNDYAKFYVTKARILALKGNYSDADKLVQIAISKENSKRDDYALTIINYELYRRSFKEEQIHNFLYSKIKKLEEIVNNLSSLTENNDLIKNIEYTPNVYEGNDPYAFISYARKDKEIINSMLKEFDKHHVRYWFDFGITPGEHWTETLGNKIKGCSTFIVVLTKNSIPSLNVRRELTFAQSELKKMIVVVIDENELTNGMKMQFSIEQIIFKRELSINQLVSKIIRSLNKEIKNEK